MKQRLSLQGRGLQLLAQREHSRLELRRKLLRHAQEEQSDALRAASPGDGDAKAPAHREAGPAEFPEGCFGGDPGPETDAPNPDLDARVEAALDWLQARRHLSEERFMESRVHVRMSRFGHLRIRQELAQHGLELPAEDLRALQDSEYARARAVWQRKFGELPADAKARLRQMRFLAGRGFSGDVIRQVLQAETEE